MRIVIDLPDTVLDKLEKDGAKEKRVRKHHIEKILEDYAKTV